MCIAFAFGLALPPLGCQDPLTLIPERQTVRALWDPTTRTMPTPTDLARSSTTGLLTLPIEPTMTPAEQEFRAYLNSLDGYPITSTIAMPVSGPVDIRSLAGSVVLARYDADGSSERVDVQESFVSGTQNQIVTTPRTPLVEGSSYVYGLWGYDGGAQGVEGVPLVADSAFYLVRSKVPLTKHLSAIPGMTYAAREETASELEDVRRTYTQVYDRLATYGLDRARMATAGAFTVTSRPSFWFDTRTGKLPIPNNVLLHRETGLVALPEREADDHERAQVKRALSRYDGFSTTSALVIEATAKVNMADIIDPSMIRVFKVEHDGTVVEHKALERGVFDDGHTFWVRPKLGFDDASNYVYIVRRGVRALEGARVFEPQPVGAMLQLKSKLLMEGRSELMALDDDSAERLEPARREASIVLDELELHGVKREEIALAVPFRTLSAAGYLMDWRAKIYKQGVRTNITDVLATSPVERGLLLVMPSVRSIVTGKLTTLNYLNKKTLRMHTDGASSEEQIDFVLTIPATATVGEPIKTVLFGHGLATSRELTYLIAERLARAGWAVISVDLPYHGKRSVCLKDGDCKGDSTCNDEHQCITTSGAQGELHTFSSPWPNGPVYPVTSGDPFIDMHDIEGSRDHFVQAVIDLCQLRRVISNADWAKHTGGYTLNKNDVVYLGMSLGGILGAVLSVVEPSIGSYMLNVPGGSLIDMVEHSAAFSSLYHEALESRGIMSRKGDEYFKFADGIRWMTDPVDPFNIMWRAVREPILYVDPVDGQQKHTPLKRIMLQMARNDSVVPNISTRLLSERSGVPVREYTPTISNHAFLFDPTSSEGRRARDDMVEFFEQR